MEIRLFDPAIIQTQEPESTVADIVRAYLSWLKVRVSRADFSASHLENARYYLNLFAGQFSQPVSACRQRDLVQWLALHPAWKSGHTKKNAISIVVSCFAWAADEEGGALIERSPYKRVKSVSAIPYEPRRPATAAEYIAFMRFGSRELRRAIFFLRRTGARTKEMRELRWEHVVLDVADPFILIVKPKAYRSTGLARKIGLDAATANWFRAMRRRSGTGLVFLNCHDQPWQSRSFAQHLRRWAVRIGLDEGAESRVTAYCLRHSYTVAGIEGGVTTREIADQLGHSNTKMIDTIYGKHTRHREAHLGNVAKKILRNRPRDLGKNGM